MSDRRVMFFGDSFTAGTGDPSGRGGWVGRAAAAAHAAAVPLLTYNLGVRRETSADIAARWRAEAAPRMAAREAVYGIVLSFGTNDTTIEHGRVRVVAGDAAANLGRMLGEAAAIGLPAFVVGPPPACDAAQDLRIAALTDAFARLAGERGVPFVGVSGRLAGDPAWTAEAAAGDGVHPAAGGYEALAGLVLGGGWLRWLRSLA